MAHQVLEELQKLAYTTNRVSQNCWNYLTSTYYWWLLRMVTTFPFDSKWKELFA